MAKKERIFFDMALDSMYESPYCLMLNGIFGERAEPDGTTPIYIRENEDATSAYVSNEPITDEDIEEWQRQQEEEI